MSATRAARAIGFTVTSEGTNQMKYSKNVYIGGCEKERGFCKVPHALSQLKNDEVA